MHRLLGLLLALAPAVYADTGNALIDYDGFARSVAEVRQLREARRIPEAQFMRMAAEAGTVVLDARSERLFRLRHVKGAMNLSFPEFTEETLARLIPAKDTRVLIYCNNNITRRARSRCRRSLSSSAPHLSTSSSLHA
jgi:rhodanese-related sulfurtransferase